ncbi:Uncharacterised protein g9735 [Pycnogonum litorale]
MASTPVNRFLFLVVVLTVVPNQGMSIPYECYLQPLNGPCKAAIPTYYYDVNIGKCSIFFYGGCRGNGNKFVTRHICEDKCKHKAQ